MKDKVEFRLIYIREAHAVDSRSPMGPIGGRVVEEPVSVEERIVLAKECCVALKLGKLPMAVDGLDDAASKNYAAWPDRLFLIDGDGKFAYVGAPGPKGFDPEALEAAIKKLFAPSVEKKETPAGSSNGKG